MVSYTVKSIAQGMMDHGAQVDIYSLANHPAPLELAPKALLPWRGYGYTHRLYKDKVSALTRLAKPRIKPGDIVYSWLGAEARHIRTWQALGATVVQEMINCTQVYCEEKLIAAHAAAGIDYPVHINEATKERELQTLLAADAVFCPNPEVTRSVQDYGVPPERCLNTSYGWSNKRITWNHPRTSKRALNYLFVGTGCVRKGLFEVLSAWQLAASAGTLTIAGHIDKAITKRCANMLRVPGIRLLGHVGSIDEAYKEADVFLFPSWEEGGPQVTLEAMASGLIPICTPAGSAGAFSSADDFAITVKPGSISDVVAAIRRCDTRSDWVAASREQACQRALQFEWHQVAGQRLEQMLQVHRSGRN